MAYYDDDGIRPVTRITAGAIGETGRRVFVLQVQLGDQLVSWVVEKEQVLHLSRAIPQLLARVHAEFPELTAPVVAANPRLDLSEPIVPEFRVGSIGLDYDRIHDVVVLTLVDADALDPDSADEFDPAQKAPEQNLYTTRGQALLLSQQAELVILAGRPACPACGEPIDYFGHFCLPAGTRSRRSDGYLQ